MAIPDRFEISRCSYCNARGKIVLCCGKVMECRDCRGRGLVCNLCRLPFEECSISDCPNSSVCGEYVT